MMSNAMDIEDEDDLKAVSTGKTLRCAGAALMLALAQVRPCPRLSSPTGRNRLLTSSCTVLFSCVVH